MAAPQLRQKLKVGVLAMEPPARAPLMKILTTVSCECPKRLCGSAL